MEWWHLLIIIGLLGILGVFSVSFAGLLRYWRIKRM